jgi:flagellin
MLGITTSAQAKSTEKLSSGYKINRAADDAAGLSISEKMRKQIRGLTQASSNAQDGISAVQTAEGALTEVQDMLQRMNELAVKAANGTNSETDRSYIQSEVDQLVTEIDRVSTTTKFNETYLLKGTNADGTVAKLSYTTAKDSIGTKIGGSNLSFDADGIATVSLGSDSAATTATTSTNTYVSQTGSTTSLTAQCTSSYTEAVKEGQKLVIDGTTYALYEDASDAAMETLSHTDDGTHKYFTNMDKFVTAVKAAANKAVGGDSGDIKSISVATDGTVSVSAFADLNNSLDLSLHVGADSTKDNKIGMSINMMSARGLGVNGLDVSGADYTNATNAIDTITDAIQKVSTQRSALGAIQNRLEHTINNLDNVVENTTSAESAIRDTDMATEMVRYSNNNILAQAGQAMLAQANQSNQGVLSLLG